ncbi:hypothetical protein [Mycoplasma sp. P36-A1]|uniref:hypothetical protein n=1 Tax=Mycoplasma sp. P36-A1 TaxID=3252900 RepID=UPI003C2D4880
MFKRVLTLISVSLLLIVSIFAGGTMYLVFTNPSSSFVFNPLAISFIFAAVMIVVCVFLTGYAYKFNDRKLIIYGTIALVISTIPNIIVGLQQGINDPYLLSKLIAPSLLLNLVMLNLYTPKYDAWEAANVKESRKSHYKKR